MPVTGGLAVKKAEDWTNDPGQNSLRLLPSGPDRVGEIPVHSPIFRVKYINISWVKRKLRVLNIAKKTAPWEIILP